jgi:hypothetical protein
MTGKHHQDCPGWPCKGECWKRARRDRLIFSLSIIAMFIASGIIVIAAALGVIPK